MLFFVGGFFILLGLMRIVVILASSGRPKSDVVIKEMVSMKLKSDLFGFGGNQPHARVNFNANGTDYETDVFVNKKFKGKPGDTIKIAYPASNPKNAKVYDPGMEWKLALGLLGLGILVCAISVAVSMALN